MTTETKNAILSMLISWRTNYSSSPRISSTGAADGPAPPAPLTLPSSASTRTTPTGWSVSRCVVRQVRRVLAMPSKVVHRSKVVYATASIARLFASFPSKRWSKPATPSTSPSLRRSRAIWGSKVRPNSWSIVHWERDTHKYPSLNLPCCTCTEDCTLSFHIAMYL